MINVAIDAAKQAGELALKYFKSQPKVSYKADKSPVTKADIEVEKLIRSIISRKFPDHGIIGEELPPVNPKAKFQWIIDPIDGTRDFVRAHPFWATFIAVLENNNPIVGVAFYPVSNDLLCGKKGGGTFINNKKTRVSKTKKLDDAYITFGNLKRFIEKKTLDSLLNLIEKTRSGRNYGNFQLKLLLEGKVDIDIEPFGAIYDFATPCILVEEAGGKFTDFKGEKSLTTGNALLSNGILHNQVLKILN